MQERLDHTRLSRELLDLLALEPGASAAALSRRLGISQPAFSRLARRLGPALLVVGRARATRYAARREVPGVGRSAPLFEIDDQGRARNLASLHAVRPRGFFVEPHAEDVAAGFHPDLPWFLHDLRPAGFLGRLIPRQHPELGLPADPRDWSGDLTLGYLARHGWDTPGALLVGEEALRLHLARATEPPAGIAPSQRARRYPRLAEDALAAGIPGSSAGGEQAKFLGWRAPGPVAVLVKFSPPVGEPVGRRLADLLVCEHLAHGVIAAHGFQAPRSELVEAGGRLFLEVERFDRLAWPGRRGVLSLAALDLEHVGRQRGWSETAAALCDLGLIDRALLSPIRWLEAFGRLIGDSDMHPGNLSFFVRGTRITELAPAYDRLPMLYAPEGGNLVERAFAPAPPLAAEAGVWADACRAAGEVWRAAAAHPLVSRGFRAIARANAKEVASLAGQARLLP